MKGLPKRCYAKHGAIYFVDMDRKWHRLCSIRDGLPTVYREYARLAMKIDRPGAMPNVVREWLADPEHQWAPKTRKDREAVCALITKAFAEYDASEVTTADVAQFLKNWASKPRYHNVVRGVLSQIIRFAAAQGWRDDVNPVNNVKGRTVEKRKRIVSDGDLSAMRQALSQATYPDAMLAVFDIAVLTGLRIGDIIALRWQDAKTDGLHVTQGKTGVPLVIEWSADLKRVVNRCAPKDERIGHIIKTQAGAAYTYWGVKSAWDRALRRARLTDLHIHDLRGRAGVEKAKTHGKEAAQTLLGHESLRMTEHYIEGKTVKRTKANSLPKAAKVRQSGQS